jgi:hypothetical protein
MDAFTGGGAGMGVGTMAPSSTFPVRTVIGTLVICGALILMQSVEPTRATTCPKDETARLDRNGTPPQPAQSR